jgi:hypothetical protein
MFYYPEGLVATADAVYIADTFNHRIRAVAVNGASGFTTTLAGSGSCCTITNGVGTAAVFYYPRGLAVSGSVLIVADSNHNALRQIDLRTRAVSTLAGSSAAGFADGASGAAALFSLPMQLAVDPLSGGILIADSSNNRLRLAGFPSGPVTTYAGSGDTSAVNGFSWQAGFNAPSGVGVQPASGQALQQAGPVDVAAVRRLPALIGFSSGMAERSQQLKSFLLHQLYRHPQVMNTTRLAQQVVQELFAFYQAQPAEMAGGFAARSAALAAAPGADAARARVVADYIAGMTDRFATREHERLSGQRLLP